MSIYDIINKKRLGKKLSKKEINFFVENSVNGKIKEYEVSAFLMAIAINGMNMQETYELTMAMAKSGEILDLSEIEGVVVDKHSTGGVSDTTTLVVVPTLAALGINVAKMSGGALGFTGGTIDKLRVLEGYNFAQKPKDFIAIIKKVGASIISQTKNIAPADKLFYSIRHKTASIESIPLIASSIMSKKIAGGASVILIDVKVGKGAFMKNIKRAKELALTMIEIGKRAGKTVKCIVTDMDQPLGYGIGNNLEVKDAIGVLKGNKNRLSKVSKKIVSDLLVETRGITAKEANKQIEKVWKSGEALEKLKEIVVAHGGNGLIVTKPNLIEKSKYRVDICAKTNGFVKAIDAENLGFLAYDLGNKKDGFDNAVGIEVIKHVGEKVLENAPVAKLHLNSKAGLKTIVERAENCFTVSGLPARKKKLILWSK